MMKKKTHPTSVKTNDYEKKRKKSTIETPLPLAQYIYETVWRQLKKKKIKLIVDIGCYKGNLSKPFKKKFKCFGIDKQRMKKYHSEFAKCDFLKAGFYISEKPFAVVMNPPFNIEKKSEIEKYKPVAKELDVKVGKSFLYPEVFIRKVFQQYGPKTPVVMFAPMGFILNQRLDSKRWKYLRDCGAQITSRFILPIDVYGKGVLTHSEVVVFNVKGLKPVYFLPKEYKYG
jgi:type I restriction enzyme M protein